MTDREKLCELLAKIPTCKIVIDQKDYIGVATGFSESIVFEFDEHGNIIDLY